MAQVATGGKLLRRTPWRPSFLTPALTMLGILIAGCAGAPGVGTTASGQLKDFDLVAYQGEEILGGQTSHFATLFGRGKQPVVLNFWAGQCPPCRAEMPAFQHAADDYQGKVLVVGLDVGEFTGLGTQDDARSLLQELNIHYPTAYAVDASPLQLYNVRAMPTTLFLSPNGALQEQVAGLIQEDRLRSSLERLVAAS